MFFWGTCRTIVATHQLNLILVFFHDVDELRELVEQPLHLRDVLAHGRAFLANRGMFPQVDVGHGVFPVECGEFGQRADGRSRLG